MKKTTQQEVELRSLVPGQRFLYDGRGGYIVMLNVCRALVRLDATKETAFTTRMGKEVAFSQAVEHNWSPSTPVVPLNEFVKLNTAAQRSTPEEETQEV